jgi:hypothetical protein
VSVLVVGAGRSGTSALTGALEAMGLFVGPPTHRVPPSPQNPEGFFELQGVAHLNEEILAHLGGAWDSPPDLRPGWLGHPGMAEFLGRGQELVASTFGPRPFVLKDPRIALLLPFWRRVLLDRCCAVMVVRDPTAVAWSLSLSFGWPPLTGLSLWSTYNRSAIAGLSGLPVHLCSYDELVETPVEALTAIAESLHHWDELPKDADFDAGVARINPGLRRDTWPRDQTELVTPPAEFVALTGALMERRGRHDAFETGDLPEPGPWLHALLEERRMGAVRLRASRDLVDDLRTERDRWRADSETSRSEHEAKSRECASLRAGAEELDRDLAASRSELEAVRRQADVLGDDLDAVLQSRTFRYTSSLRRAYSVLRRVLGLD